MDFVSVYEKKKMTPEEVVSLVQPGWSCCADISGATPPVLDAALAHRAAAGEAHDVTCHTLWISFPLGRYHQMYRRIFTR